MPWVPLRRGRVLTNDGNAAAQHLLCALAFRGLDLHRLWAARAPLNDASAKTLLRAGWAEEGRIREHVYVDGDSRSR